MSFLKNIFSKAAISKATPDIMEGLAEILMELDKLDIGDAGKKGACLTVVRIAEKLCDKQYVGTELVNAVKAKVKDWYKGS